MNPFQLLETPLREVLIFLHDHLFLSYGWAIVVLTILVRLALVPLALRQLRSMRHMQAYAPQIKAIQQRYQGDKRRQQEELMAFYKEHEINPFASCLPVVFQAPIFIALYYTLKNFSRHVHAGNLGFMGIIPNISGDVRSIGWGAPLLLVIYALSQLLSFEVNAQPTTPPIQRWLMRVVPVPIALGVLIYPDVTAGLVLYWLTTNLWTCGQQLVLKRKIGSAAALLAAEGAPAGGSRTPPKPRATPEPQRATAAREEAPASARAPEARAGETRSGDARAANGSAEGPRRRPRGKPPVSEPGTPAAGGQAASGGGEGASAKRVPARRQPKGGGGAAGQRRRPPKKGGGR